MTEPDPAFLDGNAAAGPLGMVFAVDLTAAVGRCTACGRTAALADTRMYAAEMGLVVRCIGCDRVLLRMVEGPRHTWLDMRGLAYLQVTTAEAAGTDLEGAEPANPEADDPPADSDPADPDPAAAGPVDPNPAATS